MEVIDSTVDNGGLLVHRVAMRKRDWTRDGGDLQESLRRHDFFRELDAYREKQRRFGGQMAVPGNAYVINTGAAAIALAAATAKTIMYMLAGSANQPCLTEICVGFDGVTASAVPALVELVMGTAAPNSTPGTGSTTFAPQQLRGWPVQTAQTTGANNCSSEPTVLTMIKPWLVSPNGGLLIIQSPLGREPTGIVTAATLGKMVGVRCTAPAIVNVRGYVETEE